MDQENIQKIGAYLKTRLVGVDAEVEAILLAIVSGQHLSFIGPPGTGKTTLMGHLAEIVSGTVFDKTFNATTVPDEVFGPLDVAALSGQNGQSEYKRLVSDFAPMANFLVLDEAGKAGSETLNGFLPMLDHRREFHNGRTKIKVPLKLAIATSNEPLPDDCAALKDRVTMRKICYDLTVTQKIELFDFEPSAMAMPTISGDQIDAVQADVARMSFDTTCKPAWTKAMLLLQKEGIRVSPRRLRQARRVWQGAAWLDGAPQVTGEHIAALQCVLWTDLAHAEIVTRICTMAASEHAESALEMLDGAEAILEEVESNIINIRCGSISHEDTTAIVSAQEATIQFGQELKALHNDSIVVKCLDRIRGIYVELENARIMAVTRSNKAMTGGF